MGGLLVVVEDVSVIWDLGLLEGVIGVTFWVWVVVVVWDSVILDRLGAEGDVSEEASRIIVCTLFFIHRLNSQFRQFYQFSLTSFHWASIVNDWF